MNNQTDESSDEGGQLSLSKTAAEVKTQCQLFI